jgi:hypothetical protein
VVGVEAEVDEVERDSHLVLIRLDCTLNVYIGTWATNVHCPHQVE